MHAGKGIGGSVERLEKGKGRFAYCSLFSRQLNGGQNANTFLYAVSVKHTSCYSSSYSNLDFEERKLSSQRKL